MHTSVSYKHVVCGSRYISFSYYPCTTVQGDLWKFPHLQKAHCYPVNLPISVSISNECMKGPCQDTIATLWACNVRPSIGTHRTIAALEEENITTMLISGHSLQSENQNGEKYCKTEVIRSKNKIMEPLQCHYRVSMLACM